MFGWLFGRDVVIGITGDEKFVMRSEFVPEQTVTGYFTLLKNTKTGKRSAKLNTNNAKANDLFYDYISTDIQRWIDTGKTEYIKSKIEWL